MFATLLTVALFTGSALRGVTAFAVSTPEAVAQVCINSLLHATSRLTGWLLLLRCLPPCFIFFCGLSRNHWIQCNKFPLSWEGAVSPYQVYVVDPTNECGEEL